MNQKLWLYVWTDFCRDRSSGGLAVAIASSEGEARRMIEKSVAPLSVWAWGNLTVQDLDQKFAASFCGGGNE